MFEVTDGAESGQTLPAFVLAEAVFPPFVCLLYRSAHVINCDYVSEFLQVHTSPKVHTFSHIEY